MEKPFVIRFSEENSDAKEEKPEDYMVDDVVSYFTRMEPGSPGRKRRKRSRERSVESDYLYI